MTLFAPFFVQFVTIETDPAGQTPPVMVANPDRGGNTVGAVFDYSELLGIDFKLPPDSLTTFKLWVFNDPGIFNFFIFANVFADLGDPPPSPVAKPTGERPIKIYVNVNNESVEIITGTTDVEDPAPQEIPKEFALQQNYPNPFNPETTIRFELPQAENVTINIYNLQGQLVRRLVSENREAGFHEIVWDARNNEGKSLSSGVYLYRIQAGAFMEMRKLMLLR